MAGWHAHRGLAVALAVDNVDTDQLIPARFMSTPRDQGYAQYLLHDMRRTADGNLRSDFPLNRHQASILVAGRNFGSGSSREAAVYALMDAGFRAVFAPSFGDIFSSNAVNNGLLPARIEPDVAQALLSSLQRHPGIFEIDLNAGTLAAGTMRLRFSLEDAWRTKLINGWDDIDLTMKHATAIQTHVTRNVPAWAWPEKT